MYYIFNLHKSLQISPYKTDESYTEIEFYTSYDNLLDQYLREREGGGGRIVGVLNSLHRLEKWRRKRMK